MRHAGQGRGNGLDARYSCGAQRGGERRGGVRGTPPVPTRGNTLTRRPRVPRNNIAEPQLSTFLVVSNTIAKMKTACSDSWRTRGSNYFPGTVRCDESCLQMASILRIFVVVLSPSHPADQTERGSSSTQYFHTAEINLASSHAESGPRRGVAGRGGQWAG